MKKLNETISRFLHNASKLCSCKTIMLPLLIIAMSCKKDNPPQPETVADLNKEGLEYINLPVGKYFIYKDSASGIEDSVIVTKSVLGYVHKLARPGSDSMIGSPPYSYQVFTLILTKFKPLPGGEWFYGKTEDGQFSPYVFVSFQITMWQRDNAIVFIYPANPDTNTVLIPTLTIEGKTYADVIQLTGESSSYPPGDPLYQKSIYYWAKNTGIIKRIIIKGGVPSVSTLLRTN